MDIRNLKFYDKTGRNMALEYNDAGYWYGRVWSEPLSIALFDNQNIYVLEKVGEDYLFPQIGPGDTISIYWEKGSASNYFLFDILFDDENKLWYINKIDRTDISHVNAFDGLKYPLDINIAFNPADEIAYNAKLFIALNSTTIAQIDFYGEGIMEDERFAVWLANFGIKFNREDALLIADYDIKEAAPDWEIINQKRKELFVNQEEIFPYIGTYRGVSNIIGIMGFNDVLRLKEYWKNVDSSSPYFNKFLLTDVTDMMNTGKVELMNIDENNKHIQNSSVFKKTGFLALAYEFMIETGENDIDGLPTTEYTTEFTFDEVFYKLTGMKRKLETEFLPANVKILDIIGEFLYYTKFTFRAWSDNVPILESDKCDKIGILVEPYGPLNIRELKPLYYKPYPDGLEFPQYIFNNTGVQLFSDDQKYSYTKMQEMVDAFKSYYASMADRTGKEYEEDLRPWENGDDFQTRTGCPVVLTLDVPGLTIAEMDGVELDDMMFGFAKKPNNDGTVTITAHAGYYPGILITYTLTYIVAGGSPSVTITNSTGIFTGIPVSEMHISILDGNGVLWETILPMADYNENWVEVIEKDSVKGFDVTIKDNTKSPEVNTDGMIWLKPIDGYDPGFPVTYQISYDPGTGVVTRTQVSNGLFVAIPAALITVTVTDSNGTYAGTVELNVGTIAEQWQLKGYVGNYAVNLKDCTQVPITAHTYENISYRNMYEIEWVIEKDDNPTYSWRYRGPIDRYNPWNGNLETLVSIAHVLPCVGNYVAKAYAYDYMGGVSMKFETKLVVVSTSIPHVIAMMRLDDKFDMTISNLANIKLDDMSISRWYDTRINVLGSDDADARVKKYLMEWDFYSNPKDNVKIYEESYAQLGYEVSNPIPGSVIRFLDITNSETSTVDYVIPELSPFTLQSLAYDMNHSDNEVLMRFSHAVKNGKMVATARNNFAATYYNIRMLYGTMIDVAIGSIVSVPAYPDYAVPSYADVTSAQDLAEWLNSNPDGSTTVALLSFVVYGNMVLGVNIDESIGTQMSGSSSTYSYTTSYRVYDKSTNPAKVNWLTEYGTSNKLSDYENAKIHDTYFLRGCDTVYSANFLAGFELVNPIAGHAIRFNAYYEDGIRVGFDDYVIPSHLSTQDLVTQMNESDHPVISMFIYSIVGGNIRAASKELTDLSYQFIDHVYATIVNPSPGESIFVPVGYQYTIPDNIQLETTELATNLNTKNIGLTFVGSPMSIDFSKVSAGYWYVGSLLSPKQEDTIPVPVTKSFKIPYGTPTNATSAASYLNSLAYLMDMPLWGEFSSNMGQLYLVNKSDAAFNFSMQITDYSDGTVVTYPELGYFRIPDEAPRDPVNLATWLNDETNLAEVPSAFALVCSENVGSPYGMNVQSDLAIVSYDFNYIAPSADLIGLNAWIYAPVFDAYSIPAETKLDVPDLVSTLNASADPILANMVFTEVDGNMVAEFSATGYFYSKTYSDLAFGDPIQCIVGMSYILPSVSPPTPDAYVEWLNANAEGNEALSKMRFYFDNDVIIGVGLTGKDAPSPMSGSLYTFFEPIWAYSPEFTIHIESQRDVHGHRLHPNFRKELLFLLCDFTDVLSGAADNPKYFFDHEYVMWKDGEMTGSLPSVLGKDTFALDSLKIRTNAFCAPKFCTIFFAVNNISNTKQFVWSVYESIGGKLAGRVSDVPFLAWRFDEAGPYDLGVEITDNNGNVFTDRISRFVTVMEKEDYIAYVENLLNQRKVRINNLSIS